MFFWNTLAFFYDPTDFGNLISGSSAFSKSSLYIWKFLVHVCRSLAWRILSITLPACEVTATVVLSLNILWHCPSLGLEWKLTFSSPVATAEFSKFADIVSEALLTASSFRVWKHSAGILSPPPLALFIVMLSKAHLTSHSKMSGSRWVIIPSWLSVSLGFFFFFVYSSVYSCQFFLISSALLGQYHFCPLLCQHLHKIFPWCL